MAGLPLLLDTYRVRVMKRIELPIAASLSFPNTLVQIIDLPTKRIAEPEIKCDEASVMDISSTDSCGHLGNPYEIDFLTLEKLEASATPIKTMSFQTIETKYFDCNALPFSTACNLQSRIVHKDKDLLDTGIPTYIICNGEDAMKTLLMSCHVHDGKVTSSHTRFIGRFNEASRKTILALNRRFPTAVESKSRATAEYELFPPLITQQSRASMVLPASFVMNIKWTSGVKADSFLTHPSASAVVNISFSPGFKDYRICRYEETSDLHHILRMTRALVDSGFTMVWPSVEDKNATVNQRVTDLLNSANQQKKVLEGRLASDVGGSASTRVLDFTEKLWIILRQCTSNESLIDALRLVFESLKKCQITAVLHPDNKSNIARLIRDSLAGSLHLPRLEGLTPLEILVEIGVEYFQRGLMHAFFSNRLIASEDTLTCWLDNSASAERRAKSLLPIHLSLQTILELRSVLSVSNHHISNIARSVLSQFCRAPIDNILKQTFTTEISYVHVRSELLAKALPMTWCNETTFNIVPTVKTVVQLMRKTPYEHVESLVHYHNNTTETTIEDVSPAETYITTLTTMGTNTLLL